MFGGSRALARIASERFDLILLSVDSKSMGGLGIYDRIRRDPRSSALPVIVIGSAVDALSAGERPGACPDAHLARPIDRSSLVVAAQKCLPWLTGVVAAPSPGTPGDADPATEPVDAPASEAREQEPPVTNRLAQANAAAVQALERSVHETRRAAQKELAAALVARDRAHATKLAEANARAAALEERLGATETARTELESARDAMLTEATALLYRLEVAEEALAEAVTRRDAVLAEPVATPEAPLAEPPREPDVLLAEKQPLHADLRPQEPALPRPPKVMASGERPVVNADPRRVLRGVLMHRLGGEGRAELVLAAARGAAKVSELPTHGDEILAVLGRYLHAELRGQVGDAQARTVMVELSSLLSGRPPRLDPREDETVQRRTTRPPPPEADEPITKNMMRPDIPRLPRRKGNNRSVLVIDRDQMARANLSRALAREGFEITVLDSCVGIDRASGDVDVIVTEIADVGIDELVRCCAQGRVSCPVIVWTASVASAESMFKAAHVGQVTVVMKEARADGLIAAMRAGLEDQKSPGTLSQRARPQ
jgi:CheY-like chemotaxis protein